MKLLFIYDSRVKKRNFSRPLKNENISSVDLFPLIEGSVITKDVKEVISF
tara:strand:+ start:1337 stop:1486 length:150 start_codon:yes stop_codon:yes gene_type:complete